MEFSEIRKIRNYVRPQLKNLVGQMEGANCGLHPLIHTGLEFNPVQDIESCQRFSGLGSEPPQTGHTFSVGLIIRLALHLEHLTGWSLTRLISSGSRVLLIWFFVFPVDVFGPTEIFRDRIVTVAVPAKELFFTWGPGEVFMSARALLRVIDRGYLFLLACHCLAISQKILSRVLL